MKILIINGPNLNMLGSREEKFYGNFTYHEMNQELKNHYDKLEFFQSNHEGVIVDEIQKLLTTDKFDGLIINAAAYTHTSIAIRDALAILKIPSIEVHISNIKNREDFRQVNLISDFCDLTITGKGIDGYIEAIDYLYEKY